MAGYGISVTFPPDTYRKLHFVSSKLSMTNQQFIRQAVEEKLSSLDAFEMAGGIKPNVSEDSDHETGQI